MHSTDEPKGSDCMEEFRAMHVCMQENHEYYDTDDEGAEAEKGLDGSAEEGGDGGEAKTDTETEAPEAAKKEPPAAEKVAA